MKKKLVVALSVVLSAAMLMSGCGGSLPADFDFGFDFDLLSGTFGGESDADDAEVDEEDDDLNSTDVVQFQDCLVERCVRMSLGKKAGEEVTVGECKKLESLVIDTKYDTSLDIDFTSATMECLPCNYIDFSDFQYLTGLKELDIDNFYAFDLIVNMDALSNCKKLEKLSMYYNTVDRYWVGDTPKGVPYLTEMISHMPNLSYLDLGYYLTDDVKEEIKVNHPDLVIYNGEDDYYFTKDYTYELYEYRNSAGNLMEADSLEEYISEWSYDSVGSEANFDNVRMFYRVNSVDKFNQFIDKLPETTEDIYIEIVSTNEIDFNVFTKFQNLKTLTLIGYGSYHSTSASSTPVTNVASLAQLPELYSLNLSGCTGAIDEIGSLSDLKQLSLFGCYSDSQEFYSKLENLRELYVCLPKDYLDNYTQLYSSISGLKNLQFLSVLDDDELTGIDALNSLKSVRILGSVSDFSSLGKCTDLETIILAGVDRNCFDISPLANCKKLKTITCDQTVSGFDNILGLSELSSFFIFNVEYDDYDDYVIVNNHYIDLACKNENLSFFNIWGRQSVSADYSTSIRYDLIHYKKLKESGITEGYFDVLLHHTSEISKSSTYNEYYDEFMKNIKH
ncbi:MAG: hypothetical protein IJ291_03180 [Lachnospiraceae bacterium]|nr:hypothetical protein [Lachnospiraceae bacterium]